MAKYQPDRVPIGTGMITIAGLKHAEEIVGCEKLPIAYKLWGTDKNITAYGQMGYVKDKEWIVKLTAMEENPIATYIEDNDPVYLDSALEVFLNFDTKNEYYINLEINANGALLCHYGKRRDRGPVLTADKKVEVVTERKEKEWSVTLRIPYSVIKACFGDVKLQKGSDISFNLYKICEREDNLHFISYTFIPTVKPDFHQPQYFARGKLG